MNLNININNFATMAPPGMASMGGGFGASGFQMGGLGGFDPTGGFGQMGALGGGFGQVGQMGGQQAQMLSAMSMMTSMMMMMANMMTNLVGGQSPLSMGASQFGGGAPMGGSPLNGFLGGPGGAGSPGAAGGPGKARRPKKKKKKAGGANGGGGEVGGATKMDKDGKVGNVNVEKLVRAIPESYRPYASKHWPSIVAEAQKSGVKNKAALAYILATTVHESGAGKYMEEIASGSAYEGRRDLGNTHSGDGVRFKGRGYVQITGRNNYTNWGKRLHMNLVGNPELAERPEVAAKILVQGMRDGSFTGKGLDDYFGKGKADFVGARAIVNGSDKAGTFAATAKAILGAMD